MSTKIGRCFEVVQLESVPGGYLLALTILVGVSDVLEAGVGV
jgi:hypothetical protein